MRYPIPEGPTILERNSYFGTMILFRFVVAQDQTATNTFLRETRVRVYPRTQTTKVRYFEVLDLTWRMEMRH